MDITIYIDGRQVKAAKDEMLLSVLNRENIFVPTLCNNDEISPYGACRLCIVEWDRGGSNKVVTSCNFPVQDGMRFVVNSERLARNRRMIIELLLARCPEVRQVKEMASKLGVLETRFPKEEEGCVLCGLCTRACAKVVGMSAISFEKRGPKRKVVSPFLDEATECIGCGSCAVVCPTDYIKVEEDNDTRRFPQWKVEFDLVKCKACGQKVAPKKQTEFMRNKAKLPKWWFEYCQNCRPSAPEAKEAAAKK